MMTIILISFIPFYYRRRLAPLYSSINPDLEGVASGGGKNTTDIRQGAPFSLEIQQLNCYRITIAHPSITYNLRMPRRRLVRQRMLIVFV